MKSLYGMYIAEREDKDIIESDKGFATYKLFDNGECYIQDLYIVPGYRQSGFATEMTNKIVDIAKERGCHTLIGSVCSDDKSATRNMKVFLAYGMQISNIIGTMIFLKKNLGDK